MVCRAESNSEAVQVQDGMSLPAWHSDLVHGHADAMALLRSLRNVGKSGASLVVSRQGRFSPNLTMHAIHVSSFVSIQMITVVVQGLQQQQDAAKAQQAAQAGPRQPTDPRSQDPRLRPQQPHQQPGPQAAPVHPQHLDPQPALQPQGAPGEPVPAPPPGNPGDVEMKPQLEELKSEPGGLRAGTPPQVKQETKVRLCMSSSMCLALYVCMSEAGHLDLCSSFCKMLCLQSYTEQQGSICHLQIARHLP